MEGNLVTHSVILNLFQDLNFTRKQRPKVLKVAFKNHHRLMLAPCHKVAKATEVLNCSATPNQTRFGLACKISVSLKYTQLSRTYCPHHQIRAKF